MEQDRNPPIEDLPAFAPDEASLRLQLTDLLLGGLREASGGRLSLEQSDVLREIEGALEAYGSFFYPPEHR